MPDSRFYSDEEVGFHLTALREAAGITQAELAGSIRSSQAILSRIEAGERSTSFVELEEILKAISSVEARRLLDLLARRWVEVEPPPLDHPDLELLWQAETSVTHLRELLDGKPLKESFRNRVQTYIDDLKRSSCSLINREYQIALIGSIGIGKSTALCRLTNLEIPKEGESKTEPVLEAGAGGITICEVHLRRGSNYAISIDPCELDEIRSHVNDFAEHFLKDPQTDNSAVDPRESQGISEELKRAIRNMSGLRKHKVKSPSGKLLRTDDAKDLAVTKTSIREYVVEVLARMELHRRDRRDVVYDSGTSRPPLEWLRETFVEINNGRHPEFSIPRRIEVTVPEALIQADDLALRFVDTKGIDQIAARPDLERFFGAPHTIILLCSRFNDAPSGDAKLLLQRAQAAGNRNLNENVGLLVLPHSAEALAVKDDSGSKVDTAAEGYELKGEQIEAFLQAHNLSQVAVGFFNAFEDDVKNAQDFLRQMVFGLRRSYRLVLAGLVRDSQELLGNQEREESRAVITAATQALVTSLSRIRSIGHPIGHIEESLFAQFSRAYASTVRATVRRNGEWPNLNYGHHLAYGARTMAVKTLGTKVAEFVSHADFLERDPHYTDAIGLVKQAKRILLDTYDGLLRKADILGESLFKDELKKDSLFWTEADKEWGQGSGYKDRVRTLNSDWFSESDHRKVEAELDALLRDEWQRALAKVESILEVL